MGNKLLGALPARLCASGHLLAVQEALCKRGKLKDVLNELWENENIPEELLQARLVLIFKKGDTNDLANYRPISLLNAVYNIYAAILPKRIEKQSMLITRLFKHYRNNSNWIEKFNLFVI